MATEKQIKAKEAKEEKKAKRLKEVKKVGRMTGKVKPVSMPKVGRMTGKVKPVDMPEVDTKKKIKGIPSDFDVKMLKNTLPTKKDGGMVKKYMGGGSVHKKKNKMATTKGWGASRKT